MWLVVLLVFLFPSMLALLVCWTRANLMLDFLFELIASGERLYCFCSLFQVLKITWFVKLRVSSIFVVNLCVCIWCHDESIGEPYFGFTNYRELWLAAGVPSYDMVFKCCTEEGETSPKHIYVKTCSIKHFGIKIRVLKPGPAWRVDPGPGRPGTGPGWGKNLLGNWPGATRSTCRVDPGPGSPG
jgi:hypothetical protein